MIRLYYLQNIAVKPLFGYYFVYTFILVISNYVLRTVWGGENYLIKMDSPRLPTIFSPNNIKKYETLNLSSIVMKIILP